jgi:hypothetical protein
MESITQDWCSEKRTLQRYGTAERILGTDAAIEKTARRVVSPYALKRGKDCKTSSSSSSLSMGSYPLKQRAQLAGSRNCPCFSHSAHWLYTTIFISMADLLRSETACKKIAGRRLRSSPLGRWGRALIFRRLPACFLCSALLPGIQ